MKKITLSILFISILSSCESPKEKPGQPITKVAPAPKDTTAPAAKTQQPPPISFKTRLHDTTYVEGSFILFLRPNDERYAELDSISEDIGDGDSDFGVGINNTLDSLKKNPEYKDIKGLVTVNRYINIKDCMGGPLVIDRDTINYGFIMSAKGRRIDSVLNSVHSGDYREEIDSYFFGKGI